MITLKGVLVDALNLPVSKAEIVFKSIVNGMVLPGIVAKGVTDNKGSYNLIINYGTYAVSIRSRKGNSTLGEVTIDAATTAKTLNELLRQRDDEQNVVSDYMLEVREIKKTVQAAAELVKERAGNIDSLVAQAEKNSEAAAKAATKAKEILDEINAAGSAGLEDAPKNEFAYLRKNGKWVSVDENVIEPEYVINPPADADDSDFVIDFRFNNIFNTIPRNEWKNLYDIPGYLEWHQEKVEITPPPGRRVIVLFDASSDEQNYKTAAVYFGAGVKVLIDELQCRHIKREDSNKNVISERYSLSALGLRVKQDPQDVEWTETRITQISSSFEVDKDKKSYSYGMSYSEELTTVVNSFVGDVFSFTDFDDSDDMCVNLTQQLKKNVEQSKVPFFWSKMAIEGLAKARQTCVSMSYDGRFTNILANNIQSSVDYDYSFVNEKQDVEIELSSGCKIHIFPTHIANFAWALIYGTGKQGTILPRSASFTSEKIKFSNSDEPVEVYFNMVLINKDTLKPIKVGEFKKWVIARSDDFFTQFPDYLSFDLSFPTLYNNSYSLRHVSFDSNNSEYCKTKLLDIPDIVDAEKLKREIESLE